MPDAIAEPPVPAQKPRDDIPAPCLSGASGTLAPPHMPVWGKCPAGKFATEVCP